MATKKGKLTLDDLQPREYEFEVITPADETLVFTMRAPTQARMWDIERSEPIPVRDHYVDRSNPFMKASDGEVKPVIDEKAFQIALEGRLQRIMYRKSLAAWADAADVLGTENEEEQIAALATLSSWVVSALWKMTQALISTTSDAIAARKFRGD